MSSNQLEGIPQSKPIRLSPSSINLFQECPYCFWLDRVKGIKRPPGIFSTLPIGMDKGIKKYFDKYRAQGKLPPELEGKVRGVLMPDQAKLDKWRFWRTSPRYEVPELNAHMDGALDECLVDGDIYIVADYKTRGVPLKPDSTKYYHNQLNCYTLLLEANEYKTDRIAYLIYYIFRDVYEEGAANFDIEVIEMKTDLEAARKIFAEAIKCLRGPRPEPGKVCDYCLWCKQNP